MKTIDFSYFIERYITGEMDPTEKRWFEKELDGNEQLRKEVVLRRKVDSAMINHDILSLRSKLADLERNRKEKAVAESAARRTMPIKYAAMIAGLVMVGTVVTMTFRSRSAEELFASNYRPIVIERETRSAAITGEVLFRKASDYYNNSEYESAVECFSQFLQANPGRMDAHLFKGLSSMGLENYPAATTEFKIVVNDAKNLYQDKARWYLALSLLKTGDTDAAAKEFEAIANNDKSIYRKEARKLLRKL